MLEFETLMLNSAAVVTIAVSIFIAVKYNHLMGAILIFVFGVSAFQTWVLMYGNVVSFNPDGYSAPFWYEALVVARIIGAFLLPVALWQLASDKSKKSAT